MVVINLLKIKNSSNPHLFRDWELRLSYGTEKEGNRFSMNCGNQEVLRSVYITKKFDKLADKV